ncbi:hypothetical protein DPEC_G00111580 [Dallia pectoralis]|uniref:Uncharacterized protein n=1 Tax=Dallia pectoralis TaxID=75939 RepID=A0ACC2GTD0_DALPE|nr:hypothetical protein DPEC_G00111580 [Dallia pectoralis]
MRRCGNHELYSAETLPSVASDKGRPGQHSRSNSDSTPFVRHPLLSSTITIITRRKSGFLAHGAPRNGETSRMTLSK